MIVTRTFIIQYKKSVSAATFELHPAHKVELINFTDVKLR